MRRGPALIMAVCILAGIAVFAAAGMCDCRRGVGAFAKGTEPGQGSAGAVTAEKAVYFDFVEEDEEITEPETETPINGKIESQPETETEPETVPDPEPAADPEPETTEAEPVRSAVQYVVAGVPCPIEVSAYLQERLDGAGIGWWMPYAICTMMQESRFRADAVSPNGLDKGILQYRERYWDGRFGDIFDYHAQIDRYVEQTANRLNAGCSVEETISRHMMSDWGGFNQIYVDQVMQWFSKVEVKQNE